MTTTTTGPHQADELSKMTIAELLPALGLNARTVNAVIEHTGLTPDALGATPTDDQVKRATDGKGGTGRTRGIYVLTGEVKATGKSKPKGDQQAKAGRARQAKAKLEQRATESGGRQGPRPGSMVDAMLTVMRGRRGRPIGAKELTDKIQEQGLAPNLKGKTPHATVGAKLATEAKKPDGLFERTAPGLFKVRAGR